MNPEPEIRFSCPGCGARFAVAPHLAGRKAYCRRCRAALTVPASGEAEGRDSTSAVPAPAHPAVEGRHSNLTRTLVWGLLGLAAFAVAGFLALGPIKAWHLRREVQAAEQVYTQAVASLLQPESTIESADPRESTGRCRAAIAEIRRIREKLSALHPGVDSPERAAFLQRLDEEQVRLVQMVVSLDRRARQEALAAEHRRLLWNPPADPAAMAAHIERIRRLEQELGELGVNP